MRTIITIIALGWLAQSLWSDEDPLTSSQPTITQRMLIEKAMGNSYLILARKAEIESASSRRAHSRARELPSLSARLAAQITSDPVRVRPIRFNAEPGVFSEEVWTASLGISTPLYSGGRLQAETAAFNWLEKAAKLDLLTAQQTLATRIVTLFQETKAAEAYLSSLQDSRDTLNAQHARIQALIAGEKAAEVDLLRVSVRLSSLEQKITEVANSREVLIATMEMLSGLTIPSDSNFEESVFPGVESDSHNEAPSNTPLLRPDEQSSLSRLEAAKEQIRATKALKRPSVELSAAYGPRSDFGGDAYHYTGLVGVALNWNLFDFGAIDSKIADSSAQYRKQEALAEEVRIRRRLEIQAANAALKSALARTRTSQSILNQAKESLRIEQIRYDTGKGTISDVLEAQAASLEADYLSIRARTDLRVALASSDLAYGRVFSTDARVPDLRQLPDLSPEQSQ